MGAKFESVTQEDGVRADIGIKNMLSNKKVYVAGHNGMVGSAVCRKLQSIDCKNVLTVDRHAVDLCNQKDVNEFFQTHRPEIVMFAAAKVGGIHANNTYPADFIFSNLMMAANAVEAAYQCGTERFLFLGSTCIYPRMAPQPMPESCLLTGALEETNEAYAVAKIAGLKLCQHYRSQFDVTFHSAMPTNLYLSLIHI